MIAFAIDLGGSHVACAVVRDKQILGKRILAIPKDHTLVKFGDLLAEISACLKSLLHSVDTAGEAVAGIVFAFPGVVNAEGSRVIATNQKFDEALSTDFAVWAASDFGLPIVLENDARLALMGEHFCGAAQGYDDVVLIALGTGIGAAAMLGGRPLRGASGRSGCLGGHIPVQLGGRVCTCGNVGCAEAEASTWALRSIAESTPGYPKSDLSFLEAPITFESVFACADRGDRVARLVLERCYEVWGALTVAVCHAYAPQVVLFAGGVMHRGDEVLDAVRQRVDAHAWGFTGDQVRAAGLGADAALYGAVPRLRG